MVTNVSPYSRAGYGYGGPSKPFENPDLQTAFLCFIIRFCSSGAFVYRLGREVLNLERGVQLP